MKRRKHIHNKRFFIFHYFNVYFLQIFHIKKFVNVQKIKNFEAQNLSQNSRVIIAFQLFIIALRIATGTSLWTFYDEGSVKESIEPNPFESASGIGMNKFFSRVYRLQRWSGVVHCGPSDQMSREIPILLGVNLSWNFYFFFVVLLLTTILFSIWEYFFLPFVSTFFSSSPPHSEFSITLRDFHATIRRKLFELEA